MANRWQHLVGRTRAAGLTVRTALAQQAWLHLNGQPQRVAIDGVGVVLYRDEGRVIAVGEHCPHLGAPMSDGWIDRGRIRNGLVEVHGVAK